MPTIASRFAKNQLSTITAPSAGAVIVNDYFITLTAAQMLLNNVVDIGVLPAGNTVSDMILVADDIDSNGVPLVTLDVGLMSGTPGDIVSARTCGAEFFSADTTARAGGAARMTLSTGFRVLPADADRSIGVKIAAAPATAVAGKIRLRVFMHASDPNVAF